MDSFHVTSDASATRTPASTRHFRSPKPDAEALREQYGSREPL